MSSFAVASDPIAAYDFIRQHYYVGRTQDMKGLVLTRSGVVIAAATFDNFTTHNCFINVASDGSRHWLNRHALHEVFKYPFVTAQLERVTAWIEANNHLSRNFAMRCGFRPEAVLTKAGRDGVDVLIYRMFRQECRYA